MKKLLLITATLTLLSTSALAAGWGCGDNNNIDPGTQACVDTPDGWSGRVCYNGSWSNSGANLDCNCGSSSGDLSVSVGGCPGAAGSASGLSAVKTNKLKPAIGAKPRVERIPSSVRGVSKKVNPRIQIYNNRIK